MSCSLEFHHIGHATKSIKRSRKLFERLGYSEESSIIKDEALGVSVQFWTSGNAPRVELVEPLGPSSPVWKILQRRGGPYHYAFEASERAFRAFVSGNRLKPLTSELQAKAFPNRFIQFFAGTDGIIIEIIVSP